MLRSNDVLRGPILIQPQTQLGETARGSALTTGAGSVLSSAGKNQMRSAAEREPPSAVVARRRVIPVIGLSAFTRCLITSSNARFRLTLLSPGEVWFHSTPLCAFFLSSFWGMWTQDRRGFTYLFFFCKAADRKCTKTNQTITINCTGSFFLICAPLLLDYCDVLLAHLPLSVGTITISEWPSQLKIHKSLFGLLQS